MTTPHPDDTARWQYTTSGISSTDEERDSSNCTIWGFAGALVLAGLVILLTSGSDAPTGAKTIFGVLVFGGALYGARWLCARRAAAGQPAAPVVAKAPAAPKPTPAAKPAPAPAPTAQPAPAPAPAAESPGRKPQALTAAREGGPDDLTKIKGVGPKLAQLCHTLGFYHFDQIAEWTADEVAWVDDNLEGFKGRVTRDDWVAQAKILAAGGETEFSARHG